MTYDFKTPLTGDELSTALRPYGPGKFDTMLDSALYNASGDGFLDEECGESHSTGWYGIIREPSGALLRQRRDGMTSAEWEFAVRHAGAILSEDSQGFVHVEWFEKKADLDTAWADAVTWVAQQDEADTKGGAR